ncbi:YlaI family protein [Ureibacillus composti]|uniref:DUF2197 domain-containing protein n=1 Tax=Lysinibacillus composti TaxID=720633 RepID=A0A3N9UT83_9BACI|nr:YlaI family protein [Lysinibacillus composti]MBM7608226.1 uncharacterized protein YlaI [Lysinibacillus composti]MDM5332596.1 YlaI family protein [Ureibacillus composti]RQW75086.1 DUF2197 domain-containing protein [Lysinibacillus composti]
MRVKCVICDTITNLDDDSPLSKKLRNRPIHTYMCDDCHERIATKTEARVATGKFRFFRTSSKLDEDF